MTSEAARSKAPEAVAGRRPGRCQVRPELRAQLRGRLTVPALRWPRCTVSAQLRRDRRVPIEVLLAGACQQRAPRTNISHGLDRRRCVLRLAHLAAHPRTCQAGCHRGRASAETRSAGAASARRCDGACAWGWWPMRRQDAVQAAGLACPALHQDEVECGRRRET